MKELRQNIIFQISQARIEKGLTQAQLAALLNTHRSNISRLESGEHNPSLDFLLRVASVLDLELGLTPYNKSRPEYVGNTYELRQADTPLISFTLEKRSASGIFAEIITVNEDKKKLLPPGFELTNAGVAFWLENRALPRTRAFARQILKSLNLSVSDTLEIIDICKGLSLGDSYWVVPQGFDEGFAEHNFYENGFSESLSLVALKGVSDGGETFSPSPELTTGGMLPKSWLILDDGIYLFKGSSAANTGREPYSEYYACQIAQAMGLSAVAYDLEYLKGILTSKCKLFTDIDTSYVPIGQIVRTGGLPACLDYYAQLGDDFFENLRSMLVFDAVIYNSDRNFMNFGLLFDNRSGEIIAPAPLYDHGVSLFNYARKDDIKKLEEYAATRFPAYTNTSFEGICSQFMGKTQAQQLRQLSGFKFKRHPSINLSEERLDAIEDHLQKRVRRLLNYYSK